MDKLFNYITSPAFFKDTLPNWLQGLGTIVAVVGIIIAWKSLKRDNTEQQAQMDILMKQSEALAKSFEMDSKILAELTAHFSENKRIQVLQADKERLEIKPDIKHIYSVTTGKRTYGFNIKNEGRHEAKNISIEFEYERNEDYEIRLSRTHKDKLIPENEAIGADVFHTSFGIRQIPEDIGIMLINYESIRGEKYTAEFKIRCDRTRLLFEKVLDELIYE